MRNFGVTSISSATTAIRLESGKSWAARVLATGKCDGQHLLCGSG